MQNTYTPNAHTQRKSIVQLASVGLAQAHPNIYGQISENCGMIVILKLGAYHEFASGIISSATTYTIAPAANARAYGSSGSATWR